MNICEGEQLVNIKREVELWKKINNHPNIVKLIDYEITQSNVVILMELCTEGSLLDYINNKNDLISEQEALYVVKEIASGLYHMHSQSPPIAHRDIKIENVLKVGNNFKICDFGSSSTLTLDLKKENKNTILDNFSKFEKMTTFMYRPPEMCDQYSKFYINEKVDVWMLGCILYALLFKKHPFQDVQKLAIISADYYIPEDHKHFSEKILDFFRLMMTPNPANRPSIKDVLNIILNWSNLSNIPLPEETEELKEKQIRRINIEKGGKSISASDLYIAQQNILKKMKNGSKYKPKNCKNEYI
jgi:AP2-associated kinase